MVFRRRRYGAKRVSKRKFAKRSMVRRPIGGLRQPIHYFKRSYYVAGAIANAASGGYGFSFSLSAVPNASEFTSLYDQYKLIAAKVKLIPRGNSSDIGVQNNLGNVFSVIDRDDGNAPTTLNQILQYQNVKQTPNNRMHTRYVPLTHNIGAMDTALAITNKQPSKGWIDCDVSTTPHYGLKVWSELSTSQPIIFDTMVTLYMAFKNVR